MNLVGSNSGIIKYLYFKCLDTGEEYVVCSSRSTFTGEKFWEDSTWHSMDTVKRLRDGVKRDFTRRNLYKRFKNVQQSWQEQVEVKPKKSSTKRSDSTKNNYSVVFPKEGV